MTRQEVISALERCRGICVEWCQAREKGQCAREGSYCLNELHREALDLLKPPEPRLLSAEDFAATEAGHGWLESWCEPMDGESEYFEISPFAWAGGHTVCEGGDLSVEDMLRFYGKRYGLRVWVGDITPTDAQREATPWT